MLLWWQSDCGAGCEKCVYSKNCTTPSVRYYYIFLSFFLEQFFLIKSLISNILVFWF